MIIVISYPRTFPGEGKIINLLFSEGLRYFHLRKPGYSKNRYEKIINTVEPKYWNRIIIHDHYQLLDSYPLKGIHFTEKSKNGMGKFAHVNVHKSISVHTFEELDKLQDKFDYVFISPVFQSISKKDYQPMFELGQFQEYIGQYQGKNKIIALGGVKLQNIHEVCEAGFDGIAVLGDIWYRYFLKPMPDYMLAYFNKLKSLCQIPIPLQ